MTKKSFAIFCVLLTAALPFPAYGQTSTISAAVTVDASPPCPPTVWSLRSPADTPAVRCHSHNPRWAPHLLVPRASEPGRWTRHRRGRVWLYPICVRSSNVSSQCASGHIPWHGGPARARVNVSFSYATNSSIASRRTPRGHADQRSRLSIGSHISYLARRGILTAVWPAALREGNPLCVAHFSSIRSRIAARSIDYSHILLRQVPL